MTVFRGFRVEPLTGEVDTLGSLNTCLQSIRESPYSEEDLLELSDDIDAYQKALISRLAFVPLLKGIDLEFQRSPAVPPACACLERFPDFIRTILEELSGNEVTGITIKTRERDRSVELSISGRGGVHSISDQKERFLKRECRSCGGTFVLIRGKEPTFLLTFPIATGQSLE